MKAILNKAMIQIMERISTPEMRRLALNQLKCIAEI